MFKILSGPPDEHWSANIQTTFEDTNFSMWAMPTDNNNIRVAFFGFGLPWRRDIDLYAYTIDFARYTRLILTLCQDFSILEIKITREL